MIALLQAIIVCNFKENEWTKLEEKAKKLILGLMLVHLAQIWAANFFFLFVFFVFLFPPAPTPPPQKKNLAPSDIRYHGQVSSCWISEKTNNLILRKLSDRRRRPDWQTNGQTGKSDFIGCCPTNVERPTTASHMIPINKKKYLFKGDVSPNKWFILNSTVYQFSYA